MKSEDGKCLGYVIHTYDGDDYDCEYDTDICCGDCMFGNHGGTIDPRIKEEGGTT